MRACPSVRIQMHRLMRLDWYVLRVFQCSEHVLWVSRKCHKHEHVYTASIHAPTRFWFHLQCSYLDSFWCPNCWCQSLRPARCTFIDLWHASLRIGRIVLRKCLPGSTHLSKISFLSTGTYSPCNFMDLTIFQSVNAKSNPSGHRIQCGGRCWGRRWKEPPVAECPHRHNRSRRLVLTHYLNKSTMRGMLIHEPFFKCLNFPAPLLTRTAVISLSPHAFPAGASESPQKHCFVVMVRDHPSQSFLLPKPKNSFNIHT